MTLVELAHKMRPLIEKAAISLSDTDASVAPTLFPRLKGDGSLVEHGTRICWHNADGSLCIKRAAVDLWEQRAVYARRRADAVGRHSIPRRHTH